MSEQNIIPSAPPLYPSLNVGDFRLRKISDCQKELENEISHYRRISKKYKRAKTIINAFAAATGVLTVVLSSRQFCDSLDWNRGSRRRLNRGNCRSVRNSLDCHCQHQRKTQYKSHKTRENHFSR